MDNHGVAITVIWDDPDVVEVSISARSENFAGSTRVYLAHGDLKALADTLRGFPVSALDERDVEFGKFGRERAHGAARLKFYSVDASANACVEATLETPWPRATSWPHGEVAETARIVVKIEAAGVDRFVSQLFAIDRETKGAAYLSAVTHHLPVN
ncbi:MAG: hypothetical protein ABIS07_15765 [Dokdonella sp.]